MPEQQIRNSSDEIEQLTSGAPVWTRGDALWEYWQESAGYAWIESRHLRAHCLWRLAYLYALLRFRRNDPRLATSMANASLLARRAGRESLAQKRIANALAVWTQTPAWVENMHIARRARSSLHHLRIELQHWPTYEANLRRRMNNFAAETSDSLHAIRAGAILPHRHFSRWRGEKPALKDDRRKLLAACLLLADMLPEGGNNSSSCRPP